jgi:hypothetical protein
LYLCALKNQKRGIDATLLTGRRLAQINKIKLASVYKELQEDSKNEQQFKKKYKTIKNTKQ